MKKFNLSEPRTLNGFSDYGKLSGLNMAYEMKMPVSTKGFIVKSDDDITDNVLKEHEPDIFLVRPDGIKGEGKDLPGGRDLNINQVSNFLKSVKEKYNKAILLLFEHPSIDLDGSYKERYKIKGGLQVSVKFGKEIFVEYVGPGFDVGDITKGKATPASISIPWDLLWYDEDKIYMEANKRGYLHNVYDSAYQKERLSRIERLVAQYGEDKRSEIEEYVKTEVPVFTKYMFGDVFRKLVTPFVNSQINKGIKGYSVIMSNIYDKGLYVFDVWNNTDKYVV